MNQVLVDSNILIYSLNSKSPKHKEAQRFLQENKNNLLIAHQNIFESLRVLTHHKFSNPMSTSKAIRALTEIADSLGVISPDSITYQLALSFIKKYKFRSDMVFDAYLVATAISNGIYTIASDNEKDFSKFLEIKILNPFKKP